MTTNQARRINAQRRIKRILIDLEYAEDHPQQWQPATFSITEVLQEAQLKRIQNQISHEII